MEEIRKIGFRRRDEKVAESVENAPKVAEQSVERVVETASKDEDVERGALLVSPAQADLIETIENLADIISSREFSKYEDDARINFVNTLYNAIALNTELTTKTMLLLAR